MPDNSDGSHDVNEHVSEEWVNDTTPFERVYAVVQRTYDPQSTAAISDRARVSPTTARKHLRTLVDAGEVVTDQSGEATRYRRSETAIVTEHAQQLLSERSTGEIAEGIAAMKSKVRSWREEYGVETPEEFARELGVADADTEHGDVLTEWQTTRRNLALAQAALAIGEASRTGRLLGGDRDEGESGSSVVV
ncbi:DUF7342 family protein [Halobellus sp. GM3]|uniref:DUF7342 family protein n=1 Tax=Halobellus sp. GM3 TaxID=3458410 RepID=UPI00403D7386